MTPVPSGHPRPSDPNRPMPSTPDEARRSPDRASAWTLEDALTERFISDSRGGLLGHPVVGTLVFLLFWPMVDHLLAGVWYALLLLSCLARYFLTRTAGREGASPARTRRILLLGVSLVGVAWAGGVLLIGSQVPEAELGVLLVIMAGLVAAGTTTLEADRPSYLAFSTLLLGSVFVSVLLRGVGNFYLHMLLLVVAFWAVMLFLQGRAYSQLVRSLEVQRALAETREEYRHLVESARDLVWRVDMQGRWTFLNAASREIYGAPPADLLGEVALDRADPDNRDADYAAFARILMGGELVDHETVHRTVTGETRNLSFSGRPIREEGGEVVGVVGTARDVTDRARAREALEELLQKNSLVRSLINTTPDLIFYKDAQGRYQGCNLAFADFIGLPEEDLVGLTDGDLSTVTDPELYAESDRQALLSEEPIRMEEWVEFPGKGRRLMETVKNSFRGGDGRRLGVLGIVRDVTERKEAEERLRELAERAEHATRMKSTFLANMSHEIRTPMNGILGMTEIILGTELTDEQRQSLEIVRNSGEALLEILNDILDLSKIEAGHLEMEEVAFDLHEVVADAARLFSISSSARGNELALDIRPQVPRGVLGDPTRLRQVLSNLIGNAVKFTRDGEVLVTAALAKAGEGKAAVRLSVKDTGMGIPEEKQATIFQEFTQADSSTTREYGGTGLGLTISRHLVSLMGGELSLTSQVGEGSEFFFTVTFPMDPSYAPPEPVDELDDLQGKRVLVVDDNPTNLRIFAEFLESAGCLVVSHFNSREGLAALEEALPNEPFHAAILDVLMPEVDGFELASRIRRTPGIREIPLMILTSSSVSSDRRRAKALGVGGFMLKPVSRAQLLRGLSLALRKAPVLEPLPEPRGEAEGRGELGAGGTDPPSPAAPPPQEESQKTDRYRILLAEDNPVNQQVAEALLKRWGYEVRPVVNGVEALDALAEEAFDLVLMDVQMPGMDGLEATRRIRKDARFSSIPVVALTAHALQEEQNRCFSAGMNDYLSKPFRPESLKERVEEWIGGRRGGGEPSGPEAEDASELGASEGEGPEEAAEPPVALHFFRAAMREAGIESVVDSAVSAYLTELPVRLGALEEAVAGGDLGQVEREAHGLKSGSRNIRADKLGELLEAMETAGKGGDGEGANALLPRVRDEIHAVQHYLNLEGFTAE